MRVTYIKLENVAGILVGMNKYILEISFEKSKYKIISIQGSNSSGKTVLLSSISPFASPTSSIDERSSLSYIIKGKNGYKEIHYENGDDIFKIRHYYKAIKDSHNVKSYFEMNGKELNENGNVSSFLSLVELHFGLTQDMMRLIRLGTNVNSFISLMPSKRKEYIGKLIDEIDMYMKIHRNINDDIRIVKALMSTNSNNIYKCNVSDLNLEEDTLADLKKDVKSYEKDRDKYISKIGKIESLMNENNIDDLKRKKKEAESSIFEFDKTKMMIKEMSLENVSIDQLIKERSDISESKIDIQSKINSYRISIDSSLKNIERLELSIKKITSTSDIQSLIDIITTLREQINSTSSIVKEFKPGTTSDVINNIITKLSSFNQISRMIHTLGKRPTEIYLRLKRSDKSVDKFLKDQLKKNMSKMNENDLRSLIDQVFQSESIIYPNCDNEYNECPYYRLADTIFAIKDKLEEDSYDDEILRYIQLISNNIDNILNEVDKFNNINIPDKLHDCMKEKVILNRLEEKLPFFDLSDFQEYLSILKDHEIYKRNIESLKQYEYQLSIYKKSGIDNHLNEIKSIKESIEFYKKNISSLNVELSAISEKLNIVDKKISIVSKYNDTKKYLNMFESTLKTVDKLLIPLETAANEKRDLEFSLRKVNSLIDENREKIRKMENRLYEYRKLVEEGEKLKKKYNDLTIILESVSTRKGIPVIYMKKYLGKIKKLTNTLLKIIYDGDLYISNFNISKDTFDIPFVRNGTKIPDVRYASQSELSLISMALSFALSSGSSSNYNILLLDEIDAGLDEDNRSAFLEMLYMQINILNAEQVFIISHNMNQMINVPMDCIKLTNTSLESRLQNVIYNG